MRFVIRSGRGVVCSIILAVCAVPVAPVATGAQCYFGRGDIFLYSDAALTDSTYQDQTPGPFTVYVVHRADIAASGVSFRIEESPGVSFYYTGETSPFWQRYGNSQTGIRINYDSCLAGESVLILQIQYAGIGTSEPCSALRVVPHPDSICGGIEAYLCTFDLAEPVAHDLRINCSVPTAETTWGRVKALYRE